MSNGTADRPDPWLGAFPRVSARIFAACAVAGLGLIALGSSPASAAGPATQIVLSGSLLVGHPTTLTATIEDASGNQVTSGPDSTANVTFAQNPIHGGDGAVSGLGSFPANNGVATDVVTGTSDGTDHTVNLQASATLGGVPTTGTLTANFDASSGITALKGCSGSTMIGQPLKCYYRILNNLSTAPDTLDISSIVDTVAAYDGPVTSTNLLSQLALSFTGGASCSGGQTLCTMPYGSTIMSSPFSFYTVAPDDYKLLNHQLTDQVAVSWDDLCDGGSDNCSTAPQTAHEPSATTVTQAAPSVSTTLTPPGPVTAGTSVSDRATLNGASPNAGGSVAYAVFSNNTCTTQVASLGTATVTNGSVGPSSGWTSIAGNYWFQATYSGDASDVGPVSSPCTSEQLTVTGPGIGITKLPASQTIHQFGTATWTIVVSNTGTVALTSVAVNDPLAPLCDATFIGTLGVGASETGYTCTLANVAGSFINTATATGSPPSGPAVTASAQASVTVPRQTPVILYVTPASEGGNNTNNNCMLQIKPCATIAYALTEEVTLAPYSVGSVIELSKGTFNASTDAMFAALTPGNSNVTVTGTNGTVVEPQNCSSLATVTGGPNNGQQAIVVFSTGETGITVENMNLNGAAVAGGTCPSYTAGVIDTDQTTGDAVVGDLIQSGTTFGILADAGANSTIISNKLSPVLCTTTVKGPNLGLNAGWTNPANLLIKTLPMCAKFIEAGHGAASAVFINDAAYCVTTSASSKVLVITGTPAPVTGCAHGGLPIPSGVAPEIATGATVIFNTSVAPFTQFGIACNSPLLAEDQATVCAISDNTVTGGGTAYGDYGPPGQCGGLPPVGIVATGGATANIDGNSVSDEADVIASCPEEGETTSDGVGIGLLPDAADDCSAGDSVIGVNNAINPATGQGNTLGSTSANDRGIVVSGNVGASCSDADPGYQVNANTVSAANKAGIVLTNLGFTNGTLNEPMENNSVSGVAAGAGIELEGVLGQTIGGPLASQGNSATGSQTGLLLTPCLPLTNHPLTPPGCATYLGSPVVGAAEATQGNLIQNNTMTGNVDFGVLVVGNFQPDEVAAQTSTWESTGNTFNGNSWGTATSATNGTLPAEIDGAEVMDGTGWGGGCSSLPGQCPTSAGVGPLVFEGPNTAFSSSSPGNAVFTLSLCNSGTISEVLPAGTEITFNVGQPDDGGTFFVTKDAIITGNAGCKGAFYNLSLQAIAPVDVGTLHSPSGQPYTLAPGDVVTVNANGSAVVQSANFYGEGSGANSCTPAGLVQTAGPGPTPLFVLHPALTTPNVFGDTDPPFLTYSTTLQASTGGVNATYNAC